MVPFRKCAGLPIAAGMTAVILVLASGLLVYESVSRQTVPPFPFPPGEGKLQERKPEEEGWMTTTLGAKPSRSPVAVQAIREVQGVVLDDGGVGVANVQVRIHDALDPELYREVARSGPCGGFVLTQLPANSHISAYHEDYQASPATPVSGFLTIVLDWH